MKSIIILFILSVQFMFSQTVVDMETSHEIDWNRKNGQFYLKDVNGYFNDFVGTWKYQYDNNKEFRIILEKVEMYHIQTNWGTDYYTDGLKVKYENYENGNLVYSSIVDTGSPVGITDGYGVVDLTFFDYGRFGVGFNAELTLVPSRNDNKMHFELDKHEAENPYHSEHPNEPFFSVPNDIVMIKME